MVGGTIKVLSDWDEEVDNHLEIQEELSALSLQDGAPHSIDCRLDFVLGTPTYFK